MTEKNFTKHIKKLNLNLEKLTTSVNRLSDILENSQKSLLSFNQELDKIDSGDFNKRKKQ